jgi:hypothetical protein
MQFQLQLKTVVCIVICTVRIFLHCLSILVPWAGHLNITAIRIPNCVAEPCLMRIEVPLDVEIDFTPGKMFSKCIYRVENYTFFLRHNTRFRPSAIYCVLFW